MSDLDKKMKQILAMSKPNAVCAIHGATANGFSKVDHFSDFIFAELFSSALFLSLRHCERSYTTLGNYCQSGRYPLCGEAIQV